MLWRLMHNGCPQFLDAHRGARHPSRIVGLRVSRCRPSLCDTEYSKVNRSFGFGLLAVFLASSVRWSGGRPVLKKCVMSMIQASSGSMDFVSMEKRDVSGKSLYSWSAGSLDSNRLSHVGPLIGVGYRNQTLEGVASTVLSNQLGLVYEQDTTMPNDPRGK